MKEAFEKIRKRIEDVRMGYFLTIANGGNKRDDVYYEGISKATDRALSIVSEVEAEYGNGWIPCCERLPEAYTRVLCLHDDDGIDCGMLAEKTWYCDMDDFKGKKEDVIAWMPLPSPYKPTTD